MKFVLFHGAFGSPDNNWFPELREKLEALGQTVVAPQFPVDDWDEMVKAGVAVPPKYQNLAHWLKTFVPITKSFVKKEKLCFVGHSLGAVFTLHAVEKFNLQLDSAIFVSPFLDKLDRWEFNHANKTFYKTDFDFSKLKKLIPVTYVLYSDNDPYVKSQHSILFAKALDSSIILVKRAGHMNSEVNLNEFPLVLDLCVTRLNLSLYQRYLDHYQKQQAQAYITRARNRGVIVLKPADVVDEGVFHFRHLTTEGFCTFYTGLIKFWDPESQYMQEARRAAQKVKEFIRVIIVERVTDLENRKLLQQVALDLSAGIQIYLCLQTDIKDSVSEMDFGIWDNDYVCTVRYDQQTHVAYEAELNSRLEYIQKCQEWKRIILQKSFPVHSLEKDIVQFIKEHSRNP